MSFAEFKSKIEMGDTVILYLSVTSIFPLQVEAKMKNKKGELVDNVFQTVYGALRVSELQGRRYGTKVPLSKGWAYVLAPTCDLWTQCLPHRTQILYTPDISLILIQLELKPGSRVVEAGTGSGSLSHSILRTIKPDGRLRTFDFHEVRATTARDEFALHGYTEPLVRVIHRDVCAQGFAVDPAEDKVDAVFLDLPMPWEAIPHARNVLVPGGRISIFSPCIEQVVKSKEALLKNGFFEAEMLECLCRDLNVQYRTHAKLNLEGPEEQQRFITSFPAATVPGHTGFLTFATLKPWRSS
ncbi:tRNA (adenine(58)-N(1))-methyltransferase catalytic subunit TRMT61A [Neocloeon triangulifer]|uniref:tRNA (adenine(58)-N(1))-methyltransferase catalytic subunit TRMT61A n=1 Tax=Neocloeon triangulifer TaxID=2078957 RepID=UPI00286F4FDF|nr:tRNA (adenine(58)-N(1))-methyltransferase catalytic subunit TRMT61A [Neocloeon triangulifer]